MRKFRKPMSRTQPKADPVTPELRLFVLERDGACVAAKLERGHSCRDMWGVPHSPTDRRKLSLEHVKDQLRMGKRAPSDPSHLVTLCYGANVGVPSKELRAALRSYLRTIEGPEDHSAHVDPCSPTCRSLVA
jgi:hypothetical protein